jgi:hypothetical protein
MAGTHHLAGGTSADGQCNLSTTYDLTGFSEITESGVMPTSRL